MIKNIEGVTTLTRRALIAIIAIVLCLVAAAVTPRDPYAPFEVRAASSVDPNSALISPDASLLIEDFSYSSGQLTNLSGGANVSGGNWVNFSGTGNPILVTAGSLSFSGYPSSGIGNKVNLIQTGASAEDAYRAFAPQTVGTKTYASFLVNVANTTGLLANANATGDYFAGFLPSDSVTDLDARVSIRLGSTPGTYQLGLKATTNNASATFSNVDLNPGTTYLVVISYQIIAGNSNDVINMWINPATGGAEPAPTITQTTASATDNTDVSRFFLRQGSNAVNASIDGIRVGNGWADVFTSGNTASQYRNETPITVTSGAAANVYPSTINVTNAPTNVFVIRVTLYNYLPTPGNHVDVLLVGPNGAKYLLMGHVGSTTSLTSPVTLTFSDGASNVLPFSAPLTSGTFLPTNCDFIDPFTAPAPVPSYVDPGCDVSRTAPETLYGAFGGQNGNGLWSLYIRDDDAGSGVVGTLQGGWGIELLAVTAADATVSGRVMTADGRTLRGARVTLVNSSGVARSVMTSSLGYYQFDEVETGDSYVIGVISKRYRFENKLILVADSLAQIDFFGIE
jgi:hypothetical protein